MHSLIAQPPTFTGQILFTGNNTIYETPDIAPPIISEQHLYKPQRIKTLANYRSYVQGYNNNLAVNNSEVIRYNAKIEALTLQSNNTEGAAQSNSQFKDDFKKLSTDEYNLLVELTNQSQSPVLLKRRYMPVRKATEHTFALILSKYAYQMEHKNSMLIKMGCTTVRGLQKLKINHHELSSTIINDVDALPYCKRTIRNHINRLFEAGVFYKYEYRGHKKPVECYVNNALLEVFNGKTRKSLSIDNQFSNSEIRKDLPNNKSVTRAIINNSNINENVNNNSLDKGTAHLSDVLQSFQLAIANNKKQNTRITQTRIEVEPKKQTRAAEISTEIQKINPNSDFLRRQIITESHFINALSAGDFKKYRFNYRRQLEQESVFGNMNREEFLQLLKQIFLKMVAPIYSEKTVYPGSWHNCLDDIEKLFLNNNGSCPNKINLLHRLDGLIWRITYAKSYFRSHSDYNPLFPSQYFDPTRKDSKSGGFAYTLEAYKRKTDRKEWDLAKRDKRNAEAAKRNRHNRAIELVEKKIREMRDGKLNVNQFYDYIYSNAHIPIDVRKQVPKYVQREYKC